MHLRQALSTALILTAGCTAGDESARLDSSATSQPEAARQDHASVLPPSDIDGEIYKIGGDVKPPVMIEQCRPAVPESIKGEVIVQPLFIYEVVISAQGEVTDLKLKSSSQSGHPYDQLEASFREAIRDCRFAPATLNGQAVAVRYLLTTRTEVQ